MSSAANDSITMAPTVSFPRIELKPSAVQVVTTSKRNQTGRLLGGNRNRAAFASTVSVRTSSL